MGANKTQQKTTELMRSTRLFTHSSSGREIFLSLLQDDSPSIDLYEYHHRAILRPPREPNRRVNFFQSLHESRITAVDGVCTEECPEKNAHSRAKPKRFQGSRDELLRLTWIKYGKCSARNINQSPSLPYYTGGSTATPTPVQSMLCPSLIPKTQCKKTKKNFHASRDSF